MPNQAKVAMTFTTCEKLMLPVTLKGEVSSVPGRKCTPPRVFDYRSPGCRHVSVGPPNCWQRNGCVQQRDLAGLAAGLGDTHRVGEGEDAAARHGRARIRTGRRADNAHRPGRRDAGRDRPAVRLPLQEQRLNVELVPGFRRDGPGRIPPAYAVTLRSAPVPGIKKAAAQPIQRTAPRPT